MFFPPSWNIALGTQCLLPEKAHFTYTVHVIGWQATEGLTSMQS